MSEPKRKKIKLQTLELYAPISIPYLILPQDQIKSFFRSPIPQIFGATDQSGLMLELGIRRLIGQKINISQVGGYKDSHKEMMQFVKQYDQQVSHAPLHHDYDILELEDEDEDMREQYELEYRGMQAVMRPWGKLAHQMEDVWCRDKHMIQVYEKKDYLTRGMHAQTLKTAPERYSDIGFKFPLPIGDILDVERDFSLPYDIHEHLYTLGGLDWLEERSNTKPSKYQTIRNNVFQHRKPNFAIPAPCMCTSGACGTSCLNRMTYIECGDNCPLGSKCTNNRFRKGLMLPNLKVTEYPGRGFGLAAPMNIRKGQLIIEYCGEVITNEECMYRMETIYKGTRNHYFLSYGANEVLDGHRKGTKARFINHSCEPNCHIEKWYVDGEFRVGVIASRDIPPNQELTYDYNFDSYGQSQICRCGAPTCKGVIGSSRHLQREIKLKQKPKKQEIVIQDQSVYLTRNLKPKRGKRLSMDQVLDRIGPKRIRGSRLFLMRNLAPKPRVDKPIQSIFKKITKLSQSKQMPLKDTQEKLNCEQTPKRKSIGSTQPENKSTGSTQAERRSSRHSLK
ncbi:hypothetical protein EDD86DRAFT_198465 [Gorgonomyces haynaldii]|nr:hypothetical protein EDD86DRAFT_198465 [Gorgonomyces haynaldii]